MADYFARLHEFKGQIAVKLEGAPTIYLTTLQAEALGVSLCAASKQVRNGYHFSTLELVETNAAKDH